MRNILLICGIISSLFYIAINILIPMEWEGYDITSQAVSELSAVDSPTRALWMGWIVVYTSFLIAFGWGVLLSASGNRNLRLVGILVIAHGLFGLFWPPMHQREVLAAGGGTITDTLHIVWTAITVLMMMLEIGFGAAAFGKWFRAYSVLTVVALIVFGILTGLSSPAMEANLPTPWMGVWERINIAGFMIWVIVFAILLLQSDKHNTSNKIIST